MPDSNQPFICRGCGRPIDKLDVSLGHSPNCPFWGHITHARIDRNSLHELLRGPSLNQQLRSAAYDLANIILGVTPPGIPQQHALRHVHRALTEANNAITDTAIPVSPPAGTEERIARAGKAGGRRRKPPNKKTKEKRT